MEDYRIKITFEGMCVEAQELLFFLGKSWCSKGLNFSFPQKNVWLHTYATQIFWCHDDEIGEFLDKTELTIKDLRELVAAQSKFTPNDIAKTAEDHRELNLANELNDLCAEFGCPPGVDRMAWLRGQLRIAKAVRLLEAELISQRNR